MPHLDTLFSSEQIADRIAELADEIRRDFGDEEILMVVVLKGSILFAADLCRHFGDELKMDTMRVSSYGDEKTSSGDVRIVFDLSMSIEGKNVLIVEDIVDTGATLDRLLELLQTRKPKALKVCSLLSKPEARQREVPVDYLGFSIPNEFVVGYGLDYAERYRNLPYIAIYRES